MSRQIRTLSPEEQAACSHVLREYGYRSYNDAEKALSLRPGTFRDRLCSAANARTPTVEVVETLILKGVRKSERLGAPAREIRVEEIEKSGRIECRTCGESRPVTCFKPSKNSLAGRQQRCMDCEALRQRCARFGMSSQDVFNLWNIQEGKCPICDKPLKPEYRNSAGAPFESSTVPSAQAGHIDHEHGGKVRGILCSDCNRGLKDYIEKDVSNWVRSASAWLSKPTGLSWPQIGNVPSQYGKPPLQGVLALRQYVLFGITQEDREQLRVVQGRRCGICFQILLPGRLEHLDRDEKAETHKPALENVQKQRAKVRGLLCAGCNTALPRFRHDLRTLSRIEGYLNYPPTHRLGL